MLRLDPVALGVVRSVSAAPLRFLVSAPRGLADLLARELVALGAADARERSTGVTFSGPLAVAYRACLWSRVANRVFLELAKFDVADAEAFYRAVREIDWTDHLGPEATLACDFSGHHPAITHTHFGALKLKDAIVDSERPRTRACQWDANHVVVGFIGRESSSAWLSWRGW
jgi:23S rRNA (guanine2445-N2)-methyltransferase / 23S rRNA (guanine2069-N7)-methyltransferase